MKILLILACMFFTSGAYAAGCVSNGHGQAACSNGNGAAAYNANTGTAVRVQGNPNTGTVVRKETNANGVTRTQTSNGGRAVGKNGYGAVQGPGGKTCVRTRNNQGCN